jgi:predicted transcriptional regulator
LLRAKLLSPANLAMLDAIKRHKPASMRELPTLTGRKEASLSRTLKRFAQLGVVAFEAAVGNLSPQRKQCTTARLRFFSARLVWASCKAAAVS